MEMKGISIERIVEEIKRRGYPVPQLLEIQQNLKTLEPRLRILLDERYDARGRVLSSYEAIGEKYSIPVVEARELVGSAIWVLAGKPESGYDTTGQQLPFSKVELL